MEHNKASHLIKANGVTYLSYVARTLQKYRWIHVGSSKSESDMSTTIFLQSLSKHRSRQQCAPKKLEIKHLARFQIKQSFQVFLHIIQATLCLHYRQCGRDIQIEICIWLVELAPKFKLFSRCFNSCSCCTMNWGRQKQWWFTRCCKKSL